MDAFYFPSWKSFSSLLIFFLQPIFFSVNATDDHRQWYIFPPPVDLSASISALHGLPLSSSVRPFSSGVEELILNDESMSIEQSSVVQQQDLKYPRFSLAPKIFSIPLHQNFKSNDISAPGFDSTSFLERPMYSKSINSDRIDQTFLSIIQREYSSNFLNGYYAFLLSCFMILGGVFSVLGDAEPLGCLIFCSTFSWLIGSRVVLAIFSLHDCAIALISLLPLIMILLSRFVYQYTDIWSWSSLYFMVKPLLRFFSVFACSCILLNLIYTFFMFGVGFFDTTAWVFSQYDDHPFKLLSTYVLFLFLPSVLFSILFSNAKDKSRQKGFFHVFPLAMACVTSFSFITGCIFLLNIAMYGDEWMHYIPDVLNHPKRLCICLSPILFFHPLADWRFFVLVLLMVVLVCSSMMLQKQHSMQYLSPQPLEKNISRYTFLEKDRDSEYNSLSLERNSRSEEKT